MSKLLTYFDNWNSKIQQKIIDSRDINACTRTVLVEKTSYHKSELLKKITNGFGDGSQIIYLVD